MSTSETTPANPLAPPSPAHPAPDDSWRATPGLRHGLVPVADGVRLHYVTAGEGEPVVLIPGWPQSWYAWRLMIPLLVRGGRRVYALDPRGFGDSDMPPEGYDLETAGHDIHVFIDQLGLAGSTGVDIVGHDVGTWIAHAHAAAYPDDVRRLVVSDAHIPGVSPAPPGDYPLEIETVHRIWHFYFNRLEGLPETIIHGREREFLSWWFGPNKLVRTWAIDHEAFEEYLRVFTKPGAARAGLMYYREVFSPRGRAASAARRETKLGMPILTLGGAHADRDNLFHTMRQFAGDVHGQILEGVGHHLPEECPEEMAEAIFGFWHERR